MLGLDYNGNCTISEKQIDEIAMLMKVFAGKNAYSKFDFHEIHEAIVNSLVKNKKVILIPPSIDDTDSETKESEREYNDERSNGNFTEEPDSVQPSFEGDVDDSTKEEQSLNAPTDEYEDPSVRSDPSGLLAPEEYARDEVSDEVCNDDFSGMVQKTVTNGTMEEPIDIEKLVFSDHDGMAESNNMYQK
ncbi:unnamed protein product [Pseudo-nitzschia multistriata]|nr:unnamed protein product [Pseudo-nitzschia multistriata]